MCISLYVFLDVQSRPAFHLFAGSSIAFHFTSFPLGCEIEWSENVDKIIAKEFGEWISEDALA